MTEIRLPRALRPFATVQYRILAVALTASLLGAGVWIVASTWQVIALGGSPIDLSFVATANAVGLLVAVLFGGALADRLPQKYILIAIEGTKSVVAAAIAVLAATGQLEFWHLALCGLILGVADGFFYPAYSALLPSVLAADDLLAANGLEGTLRPTLMQAAGPAIASVILAVGFPWVAFLVVAAAQALAVVGLTALRATPVRGEQTEDDRHPLVAIFAQIGGGFSYMFKTPWLLATLLFACAHVLVIMGPIEVLLPFAVKDQVPTDVQSMFGGGAGAFAIALAAFGLGGAIGSITVASFRLPRRYLTIMILLWGVGSIPLIIIGFTDQLWLMVVALFVVGFTFQAATVIWGTLLQRRVPAGLLGRVSSLDFFVSLALMPVSMALAGPIGEAVGLDWTYLFAGALPILFAIVSIVLARMPKDEIDHPLDPAQREIETPQPMMIDPGAGTGR